MGKEQVRQSQRDKAKDVVFPENNLPAVKTSKKLKPGEYGTSPSGIPYKVRPDGSFSFAGYGGAYD